MVKQVVVMRKDLNMRKGKMIAQGSHASVNAILNLLKIDAEQMNYIKSFEPHPLFKEWIEHGYTKICVYVNSEEELLDIYEKAKKNNLNVSLVTDSGRTEFGGVPTKTCLAIGPNKTEEIDKITGHLPLL